MSRALKRLTVAALALAVTSMAGVALAAVSHHLQVVARNNSGARFLGYHITRNRSQLIGAHFRIVPPRGHPVAVIATGHEAFHGFPRHGHGFTVLSTGCANYADHPNRHSDTSCNDHGPVFRGTRDTTMLALRLRVPSNANCLSFRFRFFSEEYPEYKGNTYNDAFIAELDRSTWHSPVGRAGIVKTGRDFARTSDGHVISIHGTGVARVSRANARGTTYDAATRILRASTRVKPGHHTLYLSIFDQGDRQYDSTVFLDDLTLDRRSSCKSGVAPDQK